MKVSVPEFSINSGTDHESSADQSSMGTVSVTSSP